ncbi:hypothetical protein BCR39DRAFT_566562 [Naematelia encephala]|uniref:NodB homology domain-containing protein n=1 Tax=Naematelia encephala TaxID=71784 RepID=A0A1Y2APY8_9TREE|nr:hypothetical protein BCR39DRAFT_566562 [Naematelia encephala]
MFAGEVGTLRSLKLFKKYGIQTTWFIPGHSLDTFPEQMAAVRDAGHEIGLHGYTHENPMAMTVEQQRAVLFRTLKQLTDFWHNNMSHDSQPFYTRDQDTWTKVDYSQPAESWMKPLERGNLTGMVEIPASWDLDDLPPLIKAYPNSHGFVDVRTIESNEEREHGFCFPLTRSTEP